MINQIFIPEFSLQSDVPGTFTGEWFWLMFNESSGSVTNDFGYSFDNGRSSPIFTDGEVDIGGTITSAWDTRGRITFNGTDMEIIYDEGDADYAALKSLLDFRSLQANGEDLLIAIGFSGSDPTDDEFLIDIRNQLELTYAAVGSHRINAKFYHSGGNDTYLNEEPSTSLKDGNDHSIMIHIGFGSGTPIATMYLDGSAETISDATFENIPTISTSRDDRGIGLFSRRVGSSGPADIVAGSNGGISTVQYFGVYRSSQDLSSVAATIADDLHSFSGEEFPDSMRGI